MTLGFNPMTLFSNKGSGSGHLQDYDHAAAGAGQGGQQDNAMQGGGAEAGGGARGGADGAVGLSTSQAIIGRADVGAISNLESVLMWRNPWRSARFLGGGLYLMVCVQQLGRGSELLLSPTTAVLAFAFILLLFNMVRVAVTRLKDHRQSHHGQAEGGDAAGGEQGERERVSRQSGYGLGMRGSEEKGHWGEGGAARPSLTMQRALEQVCVGGFVGRVMKTVEGVLVFFPPRVTRKGCAFMACPSPVICARHTTPQAHSRLCPHPCHRRHCTPTTP